MVQLGPQLTVESLAWGTTEKVQYPLKYSVIKNNYFHRDLYMQRRCLVLKKITAHFTVVCFVTWPSSKGGVDSVLMQTSVLFIGKN